jgi:hypothetical protein
VPLSALSAQLLQRAVAESSAKKDVMLQGETKSVVQRLSKIAPKIGDKKREANLNRAD